LDQDQNSTKNGWVVKTENLTKQFGDEKAVNELTFEVPSGKILGLIGPSGCGKTTTVRLLTGILKPSQGQAIVLGSDPRQFSKANRLKIGYMPQMTVLYPNLSVWENLRFSGSIYGVNPFGKKRLLEILKFVELEEHSNKKVRDLSGGMQRRLSLAAAIIHEPSLLFLDEPTGGVDPVLRRKFWDHFEELRDRGKTLFVTTQIVGEAAYCDLVMVMRAGSIIVMDTPEGLRRRAFNGEVVNVKVKDFLKNSATHELLRIEGVKKVLRINDTHVQLVVNEAKTVIPKIINWGKTQNIDVESIEEYQPPFDDVFVRLVKNDNLNNQKWDDGVYYDS